MNIQKAIEILTKWKDECSYDNDGELEEAENLGIEALKARKVWDDNEGFDPDEALPGETED